MTNKFEVETPIIFLMKIWPIEKKIIRTNIFYICNVTLIFKLLTVRTYDETAKTYEDLTS